MDVLEMRNKEVVEGRGNADEGATVFVLKNKREGEYYHATLHTIHWPGRQRCRGRWQKRRTVLCDSLSYQLDDVHGLPTPARPSPVHRERFEVQWLLPITCSKQ